MSVRGTKRTKLPLSFRCRLLTLSRHFRRPGRVARPRPAYLMLPRRHHAGREPVPSSSWLFSVPWAVIVPMAVGGPFRIDSNITPINGRPPVQQYNPGRGEITTQQIRSERARRIDRSSTDRFSHSPASAIFRQLQGHHSCQCCVRRTRCRGLCL